MAACFRIIVRVLMSVSDEQNLSLRRPDRGTARGAPDSLEMGSSKGISFTTTLIASSASGKILKSDEIFVEPDCIFRHENGHE